MSSMPAWLQQLLPILILLAAIAVVLMRLPKVELGHSDAFKRRRFLNWFPLGMTYAFLYMGRYNLNEATSALGHRTTNADFGTIFSWGTIVYGVAFLLNGPLTDRLGGRKTILLSAGGAAVCNVLMGLVVYAVLAHDWQPPGGLVVTLSVLYVANMYFQSFGAVSIVKVNAAWFHLRERGLLGGVFGILISLGLYFAYDWSRMIAKAAPTWWVFFVPAAILAAFVVLDFFVIRDTPGETGHPDFDTADASWDAGARPSVWTLLAKMLSNPTIVVILLVEFCSGFMRNAVMQWFPKFAKATGAGDTFVAANWGMLLCVAGITGGMFAGVISDKVFDSRRGPVSAVLYAGMTLGAVATLFLIDHSGLLGWTVIFMSLCVIGVHGMLSGTATMDFGGRKNTGVVVGVVDGAVYAGTAVQSLLLGNILPSGEAAKVAHNWSNWPIALVPLSVVGLVLATRVWNAKPQPKVAPPTGALATSAASSPRTGTEG